MVASLKICLPCTHESWADVVSHTPVAAEGGVDLINNENVIGARFTTSGYISYPWSGFAAQPPTTWTIEAIVVLDNSHDGYICGFTAAASGDGLFDRSLYIRGGQFGVYTNGASRAHAMGGAATPGQHHLIAVGTPTTLTLYVDGEPAAATSSDGGSVAYPAPPYFVIGQASTYNNTSFSYLPSGAASCFVGTMLLATVSDYAYLSSEITRRLNNPWEFLWWQQPNVEVITSANLATGWDVGVWDETRQLIPAPKIDAVTLALFEGGYLDLRPAGVTVEYVTQSEIGRPIFAFDVEVAGETVTAPDVSLAGWDIASWGSFTAT